MPLPPCLTSSMLTNSRIAVLRYLLLCLLVFGLVLSSLPELSTLSRPAALCLHPSSLSRRHPLAQPANASALQQAARLPLPLAPEQAFTPFSSFQRSLAFRSFSPTELLQCLARSGGVALVGDSTLREVTTVLLEFLGRPRIKVQGVPWAAQRADEQFDVVGLDGAPASAGIYFRFAQNVHPDLGARVADAALSLGVRVVVAHSGFWDLLPDSGATAENWLQRYQRGVAAFLEGVRGSLAPQLAAQEGAGLPPRRWFFRTINPTVLSRLDALRRSAIPPGAVHAANAFLREALAAASDKGGPVWELLDMADLVPYGQEGLVREDGYHPTDESALATFQVVANRLCGEKVTGETLAALAALI